MSPDSRESSCAQLTTRSTPCIAETIVKATSLRTIAIIPVYHDEGNVLKVLAKFKERTVDEVCVVADCLCDNESKQVEAAARVAEVPVHFIINKARRGIGYALREGIRYAIHEGYDVAVILAGNNKDDPREIPRLLGPILEGGYDYVQGSRFLPGGKHVKNPFLRGVFSRLYPFLWTLLTNVRCTDVTNGFRAYRLQIISDTKIDIRQDWLSGYELEYYIHYKALTLGYRTKEVPVSKVYPHNHKGGYSKISPLRDWWKIVRPLVYLRLGIKN